MTFIKLPTAIDPYPESASEAPAAPAAPVASPYHKRGLFDPALQALADQFAVLAHPARLAILLALAERKACVCGDLVDLLPLAQPTVSRHLKELRLAGLIQGETEGPRACYCLSPAGLTLLQRQLAGLLAPIVDAACCTPDGDGSTNTCC